MKINIPRPKLELINLVGLKKAPGTTKHGTGDTTELEETIDEKGFIPPLIIGRTEDGTEFLIDGDLRNRALQNRGHESALCLVYEGLTEAEMAHLWFISNTARKDLTPIEIALHLKRMIEKYGLSYKEMAALGYGSKSQICKYLALLKLSPSIQKQIAEGTLTVAHGSALLKAGNPDEVAKLVVQNNWSAAKTDKFIEDLKAKQDSPKEVKPENDDLKGADTSNLEDGAVNFICSGLSSVAFSKGNRPYLESQVFEAERLLPEGGVVVVYVPEECRESAYRLFNRQNCTLTPVADFMIQVVAPDFEPAIQKYIRGAKHAEYKAQTDNYRLLVYKNPGDRSVSADVVEGSKLTLEEARTLLSAAWTLRAANAKEEIVTRAMRMYSFNGDTVLDLFAGNETVNMVAPTLGRSVVTDEADAGADPKPVGMQEHVKKGLEDMEANQPKKPEVEVMASEGMAEAANKITENQAPKLENA